MAKPNTRLETITPKFVEYMPKVKEHGILYVSYKYSLAIQLCACGCGHEVVTPISRQEWSLIEMQFLDKGPEISLHPSIGNFQFPCKSHYYITKNKVRWL